MDELFKTFLVLRTKRLELVEIRQVHLPDLFQIFSNLEVTKYYNVVPLKEMVEAQKFIDHFYSRYNSKAAIRWGIALNGQQGLIGTLGFNNFIYNHRANIGYELLPLHWGKGIITEALAAILRFGFDVLKVNRIEAEVMMSNVASEHVLHKLGFTMEGVLRDWMYFDGRHYDISMYALLSRDSTAQEQKATNSSLLQ